MGIPTLNEGSRCFVRAKFYDNQGKPQIPTSVAYRIDCETTRTLVQDWTFITPGASVEVQIDATVNVMVNQRDDIERMTVTFMCNADPPEDAFTEIQQYDLIALQAEAD
jgi:hypothetical protein